VAEKSEANPKRPGAAPDVLKINVPFEEAIRRLVTRPVPPEGLPEPRLRERRSPKAK
jgi:hypothetical protein